jgi:hypothetical protein
MEILDGTGPLPLVEDFVPIKIYFKDFAQEINKNGKQILTKN